MLFANCWYVVGESGGFGVAPVAVRALGQDLVVYRRPSDQRLVVLSDRCPHRMARLSAGVVDGDHLRCPYHHWAFSSDGACVDVPSNPPGSRIPSRARVDSYPVEEEYGWVWVFLGDTPDGERPRIPPLPGYGEPGWRAVRGEYVWNAHYTRVVENAVDLAHTPFLHARSFGNPEAPVMPVHDVIEDAETVSIDVTLPIPTPKGLTRLFVAPGNNRVRLGVWPPAVNWLEATFPNGWRMMLLLANLPVDEQTTRTFWLQLRTFFTTPLADPVARAFSLQILGEDRATVEGQGASPVPLVVTEDLSTRADALSLAYRRRLAQLAPSRLDAGTAKRRAEAGLFSALGSPARRETGLAGAWVVPCVPVAGVGLGRTEEEGH